jgi:capsular exopolysaccharide synthesis family protein
VELRRYLQIVGKWLWLIALSTLLAAGVSYGISSYLPPIYNASTTLLVTAGGDLGSDWDTVIAREHLATTYKELLTSLPVLEQTATDLGLDPGQTREWLKTNKVAVTQIPDTSIIKLTVEDSDPRLAMEIANGIVVSFTQAVRDLKGSRSRDLFVAEPAIQPVEPIAPRKLLNTLAAAVVGFTLAIGTAFLIELQGDTLETAKDIHQSLSLPTLATIPPLNRRQKRSKTPAAVAYPSSPLSHAYRTLRTRLQLYNPNSNLHSLLIVSPLSREEGANVVVNLGGVMAESGLKVLLVDADMRQPQLHCAFDLSGEPGLCDLLAGAGDCREYITETGTPNLRLLPGGSPPPDPLMLLSSQEMVQLIEELKTKTDVVLFNAPPILADTDATVLASQVGGTLLVVESRSTRQEAAMQALEALHSVEAQVIGVALNKARE